MCCCLRLVNIFNMIGRSKLNERLPESDPVTQQMLDVNVLPFVQRRKCKNLKRIQQTYNFN